MGEVIGIEKKDLAAFILEHTNNSSRGFIGDGCAALLSALPITEFYETIETINLRDQSRIHFGCLKAGKFIEQ